MDEKLFHITLFLISPIKLSGEIGYHWYIIYMMVSILRNTCPVADVIYAIINIF